MQLSRFLVSTAAEAVATVQATLGPEAVVVSVKQLPQGALGWLSGKRRLEVLAGIPATNSAKRRANPSEPAAERRIETREASGLGPRHVERADSFAAADARRRESAPDSIAHGATGPTIALPANTSIERQATPSPTVAEPRTLVDSERLQPDCLLTSAATGCRSVLERFGLLPRYAEVLIERMREIQPRCEGPELARNFSLARQALLSFWPAPGGQISIFDICPRTTSGASTANVKNSDLPPALPHIFLGPPGSGKTTVLCKWLTRCCLSEGRKARVFRLDSTVANTAEALSVYCEILNVPLHRRWDSKESPAKAESVFIDFPGTSCDDPEALRALANEIAVVGPAHLHLVLNTAYGAPLLLRQWRAFSGALPPVDLVFTHLDEETAWGKIWNFIIGTNCAVRFISGGQNIPGFFEVATAERLVPAEFSR